MVSRRAEFLNDHELEKVLLAALLSGAQPYKWRAYTSGPVVVYTYRTDDNWQVTGRPLDTLIYELRWHDDMRLAATINAIKASLA